MHFHIDPRAPGSPSQQLADQVRFAVASARLHPGEQLPSVRDIAAQVRVNPNTVSRTWGELEREGIVERRRGHGIFVTEDGLQRARLSCSPVVRERLSRALRDALATGMLPDHVCSLVDELLEDLDHPTVSHSQEEENAA